MDANQYVNPLASRLKLGPEVQAAATRMFESAAGGEVGDLEPEALAAAAIAVSSAMHGDPRSEPRIARTAAVPDRELDRHIAHLVSRSDVAPVP